MPIYLYRSLEPCARCGGEFDRLESLSAVALGKCPDCGLDVRRVICAPTLLGSDTDVLKPAHYSSHGFTQYRRSGQGVYEKVAGQGPRYIADDGE